MKYLGIILYELAHPLARRMKDSITRDAGPF
jgi:hypothetical protein